MKYIKTFAPYIAIIILVLTVVYNLYLTLKLSQRLSSDEQVIGRVLEAHDNALKEIVKVLQSNPM